jgi:xanthine/uracil permease
VDNPYQSGEDSAIARENQIANDSHVDPTMKEMGFIVSGLVLTGITILAQWCVLDYVSVRILKYPEELGRYDWMLLGSPVFPFCILLLAKHRYPGTIRKRSIFVATILGWIFAILLIVTIGINYHLWIGGTL